MLARARGRRGRARPLGVDKRKARVKSHFVDQAHRLGEVLLGLARKKRQRKGCDVIAANIVGRKGSGFASETNSMAVAGPGEAGEIWETRSKADVAWDLCSCLLNA